MTRACIALLAVVSALAAAVFVPAALACSKGYSYAGLYSSTRASGIAATISMLDTPAVAGDSSHVAGWVGVGGPGLGPHGADEWLQVGLATFGDTNEGRLYYELTVPGHSPEYVELATGIVPGVRVRVAVMELQFARNAWIVVSPAGIWPVLPPAQPPRLGAGRHGGELCRDEAVRYAYRFGGLQLARTDGTWRTMRRAETLQDPGWRLRRHGTSAFSATGA